MDRELFSPMAIDALGEMMNISLGSSATAVSNMLDHRVEITTPRVSVVEIDEFNLGNLEPAMGVEIKYVEGLEGSNIMLLRRTDIKMIVDILMGTETSDEEFELNELTISAVCELMNQMMGAASTAMSDFLGYMVNISTPEPFELENLDEFKRTHLPQDSKALVVVRFSLKIEDALESEFMNVMSVNLAKELLVALGLGDEVADLSDLDTISVPATEPEPAPSGDRKLTQEEIERMMMGGGDPAPAPEPAPSGDRKLTQEEIERMMMGGGDPAPAPEPAPSGDRKLTQEEIERMMMGGGDPAPAPEPAPSGDRKLTQEEIERMMMGGGASAPAPAPQAAPTPMQQPVQPPVQQPFQQPAAAQMNPGQAAMMPPGYAMPQEGMPYPNGYMGYPMYYPPYPYPYPPQNEAKVADPKLISTKSPDMKPLNAAEALGEEQAQNLELIMEVPLQVTVEIGRTQRKVQDILEFSKGTLVLLDKLAGDQVDLFVNGKCVARGDVVVVEDNFGVRITEIVQKPGIPERKG